MNVNGYAATEQKAKLTPYSFDLGEIGSEQVDIKVSYCGICHSDLSMINNDWELSPRDEKSHSWETEEHKEYEAKKMAVYAAQELANPA
jgi:threonine dehydrogenase-like Zn-dependent dehydrogenase